MKIQFLQTRSGAKYILSCFALMIIVSTHAQVNLTYKNFLVPPTADYFYQGADAAGVAIPAKGANKTWNYGTLLSKDSNSYAESDVPAYNVAFPTAFRKYNNVFFIGEIPVALEVLENNNENAYTELGNHFERQAFSLALLTGGATDSLIVDKQDVVVKPEVFQKYPVAYGTASASNSHYVTNYELSIAAYGLDHVPGQFVQNVSDRRKVIGWGKVKTPTTSGPSPYINALLEELYILRTDSVYLGGTPMDSSLAAAFGLVQGQTINSTYQYRFYQKGIDAYLLNFSFTDATFSSIAALNYDTKYADIHCEDGVKMCVDGASQCVTYTAANFALLHRNATVGDCSAPIAVTHTDIGAVSAAMLHVSVFPNPTGSVFTLNLFSKIIAPVSVTVYDISGRKLMHFDNIRENQFQFGRELKAGTYMMQVIQGNTKQTFKIIKTN